MSSPLRFAVILLVGLVCADAFAAYMTRRHCEIPVAEGIEIMGTVTEFSGDKVLRIFQGEIEVQNGATIHSADNLSVKLDPKCNEIVFESSEGAKFERGLCAGTRSNTNGAKLVIDNTLSSEKVEYIIRGAWARTYTEGVKIATPFHFFYEPTSAPPNSEL